MVYLIYFYQNLQFLLHVISITAKIYVTLADFGYLFRLLGFHAHKTVKLIFIVHEFDMYVIIWDI